jgi:hypothetical protein
MAAMIREPASFITHPRAFAEANRRLRLEHLRSLTPERAAAELEALLELEEELWAARVARYGPDPARRDPEPSLAILLGADLSRDP